MAFPLIILALAGCPISHRRFNVIIAIHHPFIRAVRVWFARVRLPCAKRPNIDAARACGFGHARIVLRHMVPNVMARLSRGDDGSVGQAILIEASLSYLGLGVQEPVPAWGLMLQGGAQEIRRERALGWRSSLALAISLAVFGFKPVRRRATRLAPTRSMKN